MKSKPNEKRTIESLRLWLAADAADTDADFDRREQAPPYLAFLLFAVMAIVMLG